MKPHPGSTAITPISASANVRTEEFGADHRDLAEWLRIDLTASPDIRTERAMQAYNLATLYMVEAGLLLCSVRADVGAEHFATVLEQRGMAKERAYELMRGATLMARLPPAQRETVMALSKTKVLALAGATDAAVQAALEDDEIDIGLVGVRELRQRIRELEASGTNLQVKLETADATAEGLRKRLTRDDRADAVPLVFADLRAEIAAHAKKAELAIDALRAITYELEPLLQGKGGEWADATLRLAAGSAAALGLQVEGLVQQQVALTGGDPRPTSLAYLTQQEVVETAQRWRELVAADGHEKALRAWEREQQQPRGAGRPKRKPDGATNKPRGGAQ